MPLISLINPLEVLAGASGASKVGTSSGSTVQTVLDNIGVYYTPEMFGAVGDGVTDDYAAIQGMFDEVPTGATCCFNGSKVYYNAFSVLGLPGSWTINKPLTVYFNNAKLTRRTATSTTEAQSAVLFITNCKDVRLYDVNINGNNPLGAPLNNAGVPVVTPKVTALCTTIDYGVYLNTVQDVVITGTIQRCAFNIWSKVVDGLVVDASLLYGGQVTSNITPTDLAYGAGTKLSDTKNFRLSVLGAGNANATVEVEPGCTGGFIMGQDSNNLSSGVTVGDSSNIHLDYTSENCSTGLQIFQTGSVLPTRRTSRITGHMVALGCTWGASVHNRGGSTQIMEQVQLVVLSKACVQRGLYLLNEGTVPMYVDIQYTGVGTATPLAGNDVVVSGDVRGRITGSSRGCFCGVVTTGSNSSYGISIAMDLQEVSSVPYSQGAASTVDWTGTKTATEYKITPNVQSIRIERSNVGGGTQPFGDIAVRGNNWYFRGIPVTASFPNALYRDASAGGAIKVNNPT